MSMNKALTESIYQHRCEISLKRAIESEMVAILKSEDQSCATCTYCHRYKHTYKCDKKHKVISLYNICAMHHKK